MKKIQIMGVLNITPDSFFDGGGESFKKNPYNYIKQSDILISTSIYEGLPNVLLEALALKKFIISWLDFKSN